jgi:hypothetical protein
MWPPLVIVVEGGAKNGLYTGDGCIVIANLQWRGIKRMNMEENTENTRLKGEGKVSKIGVGL